MRAHLISNVGSTLHASCTMHAPGHALLGSLANSQLEGVPVHI